VQGFGGEFHTGVKGINERLIDQGNAQGEEEGVFLDIVVIDVKYRHDYDYHQYH
jgi:hypothetical protein